MQALNLILFTVTAQPHTPKHMQSINLIQFTVTEQPHTTKSHAGN